MSTDEQLALADRPREQAGPEDRVAELNDTGAALRLSVDRIQAILQSIGDCLVVADERGRLQLFNRAAEDLLGIGLTDAPLEAWSATYGVYLPDGVSMCPPELLPLARAVRGEEVHEQELVIRNRHRPEPISIRARAMPIRNERGELKGGVVVFHDITERKRAEQQVLRAREELEARVAERTAELRASEARFQDLYDHAPDMFASLDPARERLIRCNQTFLSVTGFRMEEIIGRNLFDLFHPDCMAKVAIALRSFVERGRIQDVELQLMRKDGSTVDVSLNVSAVRNGEGNIVHGRGVLRDISQQKRAEDKIRRQQTELNHVARLSTMGEMAAGLAHEINQPLTAIAAYAEGAAHRLRGGRIEADRLAGIVERIAADAHRAGDVIQRVRQFVRKRETDRLALDINELVREVCRFISSEAVHLQVVLELRLPASLPQVRADAVEIQQVLLNLVRNALDAVASRAVLRRRVVIHVRGHDQQEVEVAVEDSGPGISPNLAEQVFEPFFTSKSDGLGMGLAISRSILESHGGRITAGRSTLGGACIAFRLPVVQGD